MAPQGLVRSVRLDPDGAPLPAWTGGLRVSAAGALLAIAPRAHSRGRASLSDAALLSSIAEGDLSALGGIYDRHASDVWRAARRMLGSGPDVDDVVQNVFTKLPQIAHSYDGRASARAWLLGIGARFALRHRRGVFWQSFRMISIWTPPN